MFEKLVLASNNAGKLREFSALLAPLGVEVIAQKTLGVPECPEPYGTFLENALAKARHASRLTGLPALADDSGLCVRALSGRPGVLSARFAGEPKSDERNNQLLVEQLRGVADRHAWYVCVLVMVRHADDPHPLVTDGIWQGEIQDLPGGEGGFGYDPYFRLPPFDCTVAELPAEQKNRLSHRGQAMQQMLAKIQAMA
ncbi:MULTISPECIES: RdgB/HAM1 family non-canonical purine NTP pyrophosphatase [unclassified Paludibacterium]|uniref:RdgB/HAM1 family non-canonical purine NTP pyrophosphatase n=1 Tax=unclassified Paludibacterium TaxID=2618429 RepID=UPI001C04B23A|nr:RdgB/HAM1 family non-canonical purine NTP pyrophosphatase [Paludibacterium sp. B53371]BEV72183.1 RdgB/HAM1 family non-canonical purine NTP pyrophosphatase [Paludibacterium sp. THUN1379]